MRRRGLVILALALTLAPAGGLRAQQERDTAADRIRRLYHASLYEQALAAEKALEQAGRATARSRAWAIGAMAAYGRVDDALEAATSLAAGHPSEPWADFARALAWAEAEDSGAVTAAARARAAEPWSSDFVWLTATVWTRLDIAHKPAARALLDSAWIRLVPDAPLYLARAEALNVYIPGPRPAIDTAVLRHQEALVDSALALDSALYEAWSWKADQAAQRGRPGAAVEALERAIVAAPASPTAHAHYWGRLRQVHAGTIPAEILDPDIDRLLAASQRSAGALLAGSGIYARVGRQDRAAVLEAELRRRFPGSYEVEKADLDGMRELYFGLMGRQTADAAATRTELRRRARAFTAVAGRRPHVQAEVYGEWLDVIAAERTVPLTELSDVARKALASGKPHAWSVRPAALRLAERPGYRALAARLARAYPSLSQAQVVIHFDGSNPDTAGTRRRFARADTGVVHDILAWSAFNAGQLQVASAQIQLARQLAPADPVIRYHEGRLAERRGDLAAAEAAYTAGLARESPDGEHPNGPALRALLGKPAMSAPLRQHASASLAAHAQARQAAVLGTRIPDPKPLPRFALEGLSGGRFSTDSLRGRVAFLNFWGVWCGPCVRELPDIQKLYDRYRKDPTVLFLTINNDADPKMVREFMKMRKLDFPVLRADSAVQAMNTGYPSTWIVDGQGRIAYDDRGDPPQDRPQEWAWKIESLREPAGATAPER